MRPRDRQPRLDGDLHITDLASSDLGEGVGAWVAVAAGPFVMGSPGSEPCRDPDETQRPVTLTHAFWIWSTEVTQGQFLALLGYNPSQHSVCGQSCPVELVSWHEAAAYCNALSGKSGLAACYVCSGSGAGVACQEGNWTSIYACPGYRLPTEAEWERAYREGVAAAFYSGANDLLACECSPPDANAEKIGWYCNNSGGRPHPAGQRQPNGLALHDLAGNVWEWCHDWYDNKLGSQAVIDPFGPATGVTRAVRGGGWDSWARHLRAANRNADGTPSTRLNNTGFRCVRTKPP